MGQLKIGRVPGSALQNQELAEVAGPDNTERHEDHYHWAKGGGPSASLPWPLGTGLPVSKGSRVLT